MYGELNASNYALCDIAILAMPPILSWKCIACTVKTGVNILPGTYPLSNLLEAIQVDNLYNK